MSEAEAKQSESGSVVGLKALVFNIQLPSTRKTYSNIEINTCKA